MEPKISSAELRAMGVAHIDQYFGVWAIHEETFLSAIDRINSMDLWTHIATNRERAADGEAQPGAEKPYLTSDGVMVIPINGVMTKYDSSFADASSVRIRKAVRASVKSDAVKAILLHIDSPGGTVSGTADLADEVASAAKVKPVTAYIEDLGASAAYWVASQAQKIYANPSGLVGSIGAFTVLTDLSGMAGQRGIKVHVVRAGDFKGMGTVGTAVTDAQLGEAQRLIDGITAQFVVAVARGRRVSAETAMSWRDGRVHLASDAKAMGLIDGVEGLDAVMQRAMPTQSRVRPGMRSEGPKETETEAPPLLVATQKESPTMADESTKTPTPATLAELKAACPGASSDFIIAQMEATATVSQAQAAYIAKQNADLVAERTDRAKAESDAASAKAAASERPGVPPVGAGKHGVEASADDVGGEPIAAWEAKIAAEMLKPGMTQRVAVRNVVVANPELHAAYLRAYNAQFGRAVS